MHVLCTHFNCCACRESEINDYYKLLLLLLWKEDKPVFLFARIEIAAADDVGDADVFVVEVVVGEVGEVGKTGGGPGV